MRYRGHRAISVSAFNALSFCFVFTIGDAALCQENREIAEIVVTAQKRPEKAQEVPISMQVVQGQALDDYHIDTLNALQNFVPSLYVMNSPGDNAIYMRGFGSNASNFAFDPSVSMYIDGIYAGRGRQFMAPFFDVDHLEVLLGPQGALFGKNTAAGAVSIVTASPTSEFEAAVTASYDFTLKGTDSYGYVSGPLTDTLSARLAVKVVDEQGWVENVATGKNDPHQRDGLVRLTLRYDPLNNFDVVTKLEYDNYKTTGANTVSGSLTTPTPIATTRDANAPFGHPEEDTDTSYNASVTSNLQLGGYTLTSISGYSEFSSGRYLNAGSDDPALYFPSFLETFHQFSQEVRLLSPAQDTFNYVVGAYYDNSHYDLTNLQRYDLLGGILNGQLTDLFRQPESSYSAYAQGTYHVTSDFRIIGSLRYSRISKDGSFDQTPDFGIPLDPPISVNGKIRENETDPSLTLQYDIVSGVMVYAVYGRGSKGGGFASNNSAVTQSTFSYAPEQSRNIEVGVKSTLDNNRVQLNLSLYDTKFRDLQVSVYNPATASFVVGNAATATSKGFESSFKWLPLDNLDVTLTAAYTDAGYDNFPGSSCLATQTIAQCNPNNPASVEANNIGGTPLPFTSKWSGDVAAHHRDVLSGGLRLDSTIDVNVRSKFYTSSDSSPVYGTQPSFALLNARLQLGDPTGQKWDIALVGTNLTDERVINFATPWPFPLTTAPHALQELEQTRTVSIEGTWHF